MLDRKVGPLDAPVCLERCPTCIFRPGAFVGLRPGRVAGMVRDSRRRGSYIPCHELMDRRRVGLIKPACRGLFDLDPRAVVFDLARRLGRGIVFVDGRGRVVADERAADG